MYYLSSHKRTLGDFKQAKTYTLHLCIFKGLYISLFRKGNTEENGYNSDTA